MNIQGLQKLTLLDYPEKVACTVFTPGCNFRCPFCHNASLVTHIDSENNISIKEVMDFLKKRQGILDGVCVTGGEPLLQPELENFLYSVKELGYCVKLDTNGSNFEKLKHLVRQNLLDYVAMDIKNCPSKYALTIGVQDYNMDSVYESVRFLMSGAVPYEFRTTVVKELHSHEDFEKIGEWIKGAEKYFIQSFVDSGDLIVSGFHAYAKEILEQALAIMKKYVPDAKIRGAG